MRPYAYNFHIFTHEYKYILGVSLGQGTDTEFLTMTSNAYLVKLYYILYKSTVRS